jgi:cytochrome c oxidase subunit III
MLNQSARYYIPEPSTWPIFGSFALLLMASGAASWFNGWGPGKFVVFAGLAVLVYMIVGWFHTVSHESEGGKYNHQVDLSFRWGMGWFIFSEVMFFAAFFGALFYMRVISVPELGDLEHKLIWPGFNAGWPATGPGAHDPFTPMGAWGIPAINTALLLTSGVTLTIAHHALIANHRSKTLFWMWITVLLGATFLCVQGYEYSHAYSELNLKLSSGVYGSTFFMLTGFHGFHVFVGMTMLLFITLRLHKGHFSPTRHFGFEGAAWYWHFVDVVWLGLYVVVYWM